VSKSISSVIGHNQFLHRVHIARNADRCTIATPILSVRPSFRHVPVLCPDELRYDRVIFSIW